MPLDVTQEEFLELLENDYPTIYASEDKETLYNAFKTKPRYRKYAIPSYSTPEVAPQR